MSESQQRVSIDEQYVEFRLAAEHYGLPIRSVREIIVLGEVTRLPHMPDYVEGIVNLRGRIVPVINLRRKLGLPDDSTKGTGRTIVTELGDLEAGLVVDDVVGVMRIDSTMVQPAPHMTSVNRAVLGGIARVQERLVILLDPEVVLDQSETELVMAQAWRRDGIAPLPSSPRQP